MDKEIKSYITIHGEFVDCKIIYDFLQKLTDTEYILVGDQALLLYMEGRTTANIDLLVNPEVNIEFDDLESNKDFGRGFYQDLKVNLFYTSNNFFEFISKQEINIINVQGLPIKVASPLSLILLKCYALPALYRQGLYRKIDIYESDLKGLLREYPISTEQLNNLKPFMDDSEFLEVKNLCKELMEEIKTKKNLSYG